MKASQIGKNSSDNNEFTELFNSSFSSINETSSGQKVKGIITSISSDTTLVDINGKSEAFLMTAEIKTKDGYAYKTGDSADFYIADSSSKGIFLTQKIGKGYMSPSLFSIAFREGIPVYGTVDSEVKGGYRISVGAQSAFCPFSQIDNKKTDAVYTGKSFFFLITELSSSNVIVSRRNLLEAKQALAIEKLKSEISEGKTVTGKITRRADFGIFIDIGGIEALIPKSELSYSRFSAIDSFTEGDTINAVVMSIDWTTRKISVSAKQALENPWKKISNFKKGGVYSARISNIIKHGAFAELTEGIEGFIHISKLSYTKKVNKVEDVLSIGDKVQVSIEEIDESAKKISLSLENGEADPWKDCDVASKTEIAVIESVSAAGISVRLSSGMEGFVPKSQLSKKGDIFKDYSKDSEIKIFITEADNSKRRFIGSEKELELIEERREVEKYISGKEEASSSASLASLLGDKLKDFAK
ncbi:MAG: S1 RNA-binding domain-containing protein [Spirochaetes bacterium]|nr:S1 RNA-binding domain-containing protein [Spirochaetota bacterium]